jgi:DNA topoisomerase-1
MRRVAEEMLILADLISGAEKKMTKEEVARRQKKTKSVRKLAQSINGLRTKVTNDLKSSDEKVRLTALAVALMDRTAERVGNAASAKDGHFGVTGWRNKHIKVNGNTVTIKYVGKSGVDQEKQVTDKTIAKLLKECKGRCKGDTPILTTSDGFSIKADKVNKYLKEYGVTAKDIRGHAANQLLVDILKRGVKSSDEDERKKKFKEAIKTVAEKVGHQQATLKQHYLLPGFEEEYVKKGKVPSVKEASDSGRVDAMASRVAGEVFGGLRQEAYAYEMLESLVPSVMVAYQRVFGEPCEIPELRVVVEADRLPEGKIGGYRAPGEFPWGVITVAPNAFDKGMVETVLKHELCHAATGNPHGERFKVLADQLGIHKEWQD